MATGIRGNNGWQYGKTALECHLYMLENEIATDVCFEVGPPDGAVVKIRAHKCMLISRSEVFEAMFASGMTESNSSQENKVRIIDIEADIFKECLKYIYCEQVNTTSESSLPLIYAAKKYMLPKLAEMCRQNLEEGLNVSTACHLLEQSLIFDEKELTSKSLRIIAKHSDTFLSGTELLSVSRQTMEIILECDELRSRESLVYEFCLRWAKQLLGNHGLESPTDDQVRATLGGLLYQIRFPIMESEEFANLVGKTNVLTSEEKLSLYYYLSTRDGADKLAFSSQKRNLIRFNGEELWVDRVTRCVGGRWQGRSVDAIDFSTDQDIALTGVGLYSGYNHDYIADIEVLESGNPVCKFTATVPYTGESAPYKIAINTPITIKAGTVYTIPVARRNNDIIAYYAESCYRTCDKGNVNFTFFPCSLRHLRKQSQTTETCGQIPRLYFKFI